MSWVQAAKLYARARVGANVKAVEIEEVLHLSLVLTSFMNSAPGRMSMLLLEASDKIIACAKDDSFIYCWGHHGPMKIPHFAPAIMCRPIPIGALEFAKILVRNDKNSKTTLPWLRDEIDKIAQGAPKQNND